VEDAKKYGVQSLLKDLIGVFDTLDIVLENTRVGHQATAEELKRDFAAFHEAVMVLEKDLLKSLSKHGVNKFSPHGEGLL
jgi:molecular chaperone GrpE